MKKQLFPNKVVSYCLLAIVFFSFTSCSLLVDELLEQTDRKAIFWSSNANSDNVKVYLDGVYKGTVSTAGNSPECEYSGVGYVVVGSLKSNTSYTYRLEEAKSGKVKYTSTFKISKDKCMTIDVD